MHETQKFIELDIWVIAYKRSLKKYSVDRSAAIAHEAVRRYRKCRESEIIYEDGDEISRIHEAFQELFSRKKMTQGTS